MPKNSSKFDAKLSVLVDQIYPDADYAALKQQILEAFWPEGSSGRSRARPPGNNLWDESDTLVITYGNSLVDGVHKPLDLLRHFLEQNLSGVISGVHILPFFPFTSDDGFAVTDYRAVNSNLGSWSDINRIAGEFKLMSDLVLNHVSSFSTWFQEYRQGHAPYDQFFFEASPQDDLSDVVRPRTSPLNDKQLHRISIAQDWFNDSAFNNGGDSVALVAESRSLIHQRVSKLPQMLNVEVASPDRDARLAYIKHFISEAKIKPELWSTPEDMAAFTAGLSIHAIRQLLTRASYRAEPLVAEDLVLKVESFIQSQIGEDVIEFKKPSHTLDHVKGNNRLKEFIREELLPRFKADPSKALSGAAVAGPIGGGKTFIFEAVAQRNGCSRSRAEGHSESMVRTNGRHL